MNKYQVLRPLTLTEYESLKNSIRENGVNAPILLDEDGNIINGHHRKIIYEELQAEGVALPPLPTIIKAGLSEEQKFNLAYELNITGRQLAPEEVIEMRSRAGRKKVAEQSLKQSPQMADNWHAQQTGLSDKTVRSIRDEMETTSEIPKLDRLMGADGKERPRQVQRQEPKLSTIEETLNTPLVSLIPKEADVKPISLYNPPQSKMEEPINSSNEQGQTVEENIPDREEIIKQNTDKAFSTIYDRVLFLQSDYSNIARCLLSNPNRTQEDIVLKLDECIERLRCIKAAVTKPNILRVVK